MLCVYPYGPLYAEKSLTHIVTRVDEVRVLVYEEGADLGMFIQHSIVQQGAARLIPACPQKESLIHISFLIPHIGMFNNG